MANNVFANGREISCKSGEGKSICAFPDTCFTPPENPATPPGVPVPYPNTGMDKDTAEGTKTVKITGKEVMQKNLSYYKTSYGDEAGCAAKKGVITSVHRGKVYFTSWSMDVKFEGENVVRHMDLTTHNHASSNTNTPPTSHIDGMSAGIVVIRCDPGWTPCQKAQACAKVDTMNKMCPLKRRPGISAADGLASSMRDIGNAFAKGFKSHLKAMLQGKVSRSQWIRPDRMPKGDSSDLMHPCMAEELKKNPNAIDGWSADHVRDLQFGGDASGPFKMLDKAVNQSLGNQMSNGPTLVTGFRTEGCNCD